MTNITFIIRWKNSHFSSKWIYFSILKVPQLISHSTWGLSSNYIILSNWFRFDKIIQFLPVIRSWIADLIALLTTTVSSDLCHINFSFNIAGASMTSTMMLFLPSVKDAKAANLVNF
jgi:hypothetical protein